MRSADEGLWIALHRLLPTPPSEQSCYLRELFFQCWDQRHSGGLCCSPMCVYLCVCSPTFAEKRGGCNRFQLLIYQCFSFSLRDSFNGEALASFVASQNLSFAHIIGRLQLTSGHCGSVSSIGGALQGQWAQMWCKKPTETALQVPGSEGRRCCGCCSRYWLPCGHRAGVWVWEEPLPSCAPWVVVGGRGVEDEAVESGLTPVLFQAHRKREVGAWLWGCSLGQLAHLSWCSSRPSLMPWFFSSQSSVPPQSWSQVQQDLTSSILVSQLRALQLHWVWFGALHSLGCKTYKGCITTDFYLYRKRCTWTFFGSENGMLKNINVM